MQHRYFPKIPLKATYFATHKKPNFPSSKRDWLKPKQYQANLSQ